MWVVIRVVLCRWDTGTPSLYAWFSWILLPYTKLNFPNPSLSKSCSLISIPPIADLAAWKLYPIKRHIMSHIWQLSCLSIQPTLSSFITNFKEYREKSSDHGLSGSCTCKEMQAVRKLSVWYKIPFWFQNTVCPNTKDAFPKIQAWAYNRYSRLNRSRLA